MAVRAIGEYTFPSRSRQELYGDDQLVHVYWKHNMFMCAPACFRVPKAMPWDTFLAEVLYPVWEQDPDFDRATTTFTWELDDQAVTPVGDQSLESLGVGHKSLLVCQAA
ncbi:MAG: phenol hydroxylase [Kineosporiaceae bacterium]|nr:phenol hydroxylase [Kineosporiaceae bacterium]MBK7623271.1 phenol hydroxylase [Kineosporiaceae bacterium]MBK8074777.1 phenol hydroxylase [Kineosporiaceae bacterium]